MRKLSIIILLVIGVCTPEQVSGQCKGFAGISASELISWQSNGKIAAAEDCYWNYKGQLESSSDIELFSEMAIYDYDIKEWENYILNHDIKFFEAPGGRNVVILIDRGAFSIHQNQLLKQFQRKQPNVNPEYGEVKTWTFKIGNTTVRFVEEEYNGYVIAYNEKKLRSHENYLLENIERVRTCIINTESLLANNQIDSARLELSSCKDAALIVQDYSVYDEYMESVDTFDEAVATMVEMKRLNDKARLYASVDSLAGLYEYELAYETLDSIKSIENEAEEMSGTLMSKRREITRLETSYKISILLEEYDELRNSLQLDKAQQTLDAIFALDDLNSLAYNLQAELQEFRDFLQLRSSKVFKFGQMQSEAFLNLYDSITESMDSWSDNSESGKVQGVFFVEFDTSGTNLSRYVGTELPEYISSQFQQETHPFATQMNDYFVASKDSISINFQWKTTLVNVESNYSVVNYDSEEPSYRDAIEQFLFFDDLDVPYGKFQFKIKQKELNGYEFLTVSLLEFEETGGPESAKASLFLPGLGTRKASYGTGGILTSTLFVGSVGTAIYLKQLSNTEYQNYLTTSNYNAIQDYYERANQLHQSSLVCAGTAGLIYLFDWLRALTIGKKNLKDSDEYFSRLTRGEWVISDEALKHPNTFK